MPLTYVPTRPNSALTSVPTRLGPTHFYDPLPSYISPDGKDILYHDDVNISVAVATPKGLVVPVLRKVQDMSYIDIEREIAALGNKARDGALAIEDMDGGTFTISNGGVFGSLMGTPIINAPQSAILGMHGIFPYERLACGSRATPYCAPSRILLLHPPLR